MTQATHEEYSHLEEKSNSLSSRLSPILVAGQFLTIMPPILRRAFTFQELGRAVGYFPLVGFVLGLVLLGAETIFSFILPPTITAVLLLGLWILLTGTLHLDGFLDSMDGLYGGRTPEKRLEILRDERLGAYAFAGGAILVLLKVTSLASLDSLTTPLLLAPTLGRWAMTLAVPLFPYGREEGLGRTMKDNATWRQAVLGTIITAVIAWLTAGWVGLILLPIVLVITLVWASSVMERLPGLTGDIYGALRDYRISFSFVFSYHTNHLMTHLILVRHGETDHNVETRFQGHSDQGLNQRGKAMAKALRNALLGINFSTILASDLRRAAQTAEAITENNDGEVIHDPILREMDFGEWEGLTYKEIEVKYPPELSAWQADMNNTPPPGGETLNQFSERVSTLFNDINGGCFTDKVLIVSHGGVLQVMACLAMGLPTANYWQFRFDLASISSITFYPQGAVLNRLNDTCHLEGI